MLPLSSAWTGLRSRSCASSRMPRGASTARRPTRLVGSFWLVLPLKGTRSPPSPHRGGLAFLVGTGGSRGRSARA
eukprot:8178624-Alexandrium_andersonii.AAC.1